MEHEMEALSRRVRRMEREVRFHRLAALLVLSLAAAGLAARPAGSAPRTALPAPQPEVRARRFSLVGAQGESLARLEAAAGGGARLALAGPGGEPRIVLEVSAEGQPSVVLSGPDGRKRIALEAGSDEAHVSVLGLGHTQAALVNDSTAPRLSLADAVGTDRAWLAVRIGSPVLQFLDAQGVARTGLTTFNDEGGLAVISSSDRSKPGLVLLGKDRNPIWSAP